MSSTLQLGTASVRDSMRELRGWVWRLCGRSGDWEYVVKPEARDRLVAAGVTHELDGIPVRFDAFALQHATGDVLFARKAE